MRRPCNGIVHEQHRTAEAQRCVSVPARQGGDPVMSTLLLLTSALQPSAEVLPALTLLGHQVRILPAEGSALLEAPDSDLLLVDGRQDLAHARDLCRLI